MKLFIGIVMKRIYLFNIVAWNYRKKIEFPVCKKENFAGLQAHRKRGKSARASPTLHHTLNEDAERSFHRPTFIRPGRIRFVYATCGRRYFCIRIKKYADTKISGYVWTGPKSPVVYILSPALDGLWRENGGPDLWIGSISTEVYWHSV